MEIFVGTPIELDEFQRAVAFGGGGFDDPDGDGSDFLADAVTWDDRDAGFGSAVAEWQDVRHEQSLQRWRGMLLR